MSLITAVQELKGKVASTRRIRLRYLCRDFPFLAEFSRSALAEWVQASLASGELVLHDDLQIDIDGVWDNFRFPPPDPP